MNYIQYMKPGGTTENKKETSKFIEWLNKAGQSWKNFWDTPVTMQYAYNPHAVVGNGGAPFLTTQRRGDFAAQTAAAIAIPATAAGVATVGTVPTLLGMGTGMGVGTAAGVGGSKLMELVGGDENAQEMVGDIAGFTFGALAGGKATKATTNYLNFWNSQLSPKSIYTAMAEGMAPITNQNYGLVKYYGPTMGKTTAAKTNPKLVDFDDIVRDPIAKLAAKKGVTPRDLKIANDPDYIRILETEVARWRMNPANAGKTLVISNKALSSATTGYNNQPSIPDKETFIARQVQRGGNRKEAAAYYDALIESNPNLKIDNRFVSDIESGTRSAQISEVERLGFPKWDRQAEIVRQLKDQNTANLKMYLSKNRDKVANDTRGYGKQVSLLKNFLKRKVHIEQFSDQDILDLVKLRAFELNSQATGRYAIEIRGRNRAGTYYLFTKGKPGGIGEARFDPNDDGTMGIGWVANNTSGPNTEKGVSEDLYNLIIQTAKKLGLKGVRSGKDLRSPGATTRIWERYPNKVVLDETGGAHKINNINTPGPIVLLTEPSKQLVPLKSYLFDPEIITDGQMKIDWARGLYYKQGGELNYVNFMNNGK